MPWDRDYVFLQWGDVSDSAHHNSMQTLQYSRIPPSVHRSWLYKSMAEVTWVSSGHDGGTRWMACYVCTCKCCEWIVESEINKITIIIIIIIMGSLGCSCLAVRILYRELTQTYASDPGGRNLSNKQTNAWMNRQVIEWLKEQVDECMLNEWTSESVIDSTREWLNEKMTETDELCESMKHMSCVD